MIWLAWIGAAAIGLSLGLLGSGGSILTVPILVYVLGQPEKLAIPGSLAIVGGISLIGALAWARKGEVEWRYVLWFGVPGMVGAWLGAWSSSAMAGTTQLLLFSVVMLAAGILMLRRRGQVPEASGPPRGRLRIARDGMLVGVVTGIVGVGGGFMIVPALLVLGGLALQRAIGTSLWIIALNSASGFAKHLALITSAGLVLNWHLIGLFIAVGGVGSVVGGRIGRRLPQERLKQVFAMLLLLMGAGILVHTLPTAF